MMFEITPEKEKKPNDWCAITQETYELIDHDWDLLSLRNRMKYANRSDVLYCKNWFRPAPRNGSQGDKK